jgi:uncharacterized protein
MLDEQIVIFILIGLVASFMNGMFGIGGGSIGIPLLYLRGISLLSAFAINLFVVPFTSLVSAVTHRKNIEKKVAVYVIIGGVAGEILGAFCAIYVGSMSPLTLAMIFVVTTFIAVSGMYLDKIAPRVSQKINPDPRGFLFLSFIINLITGLRGGSGGSLLSPFLKAMKLEIHKAIATSLFVTIFTAIAGILVYWKTGNFIWLPALCVLVGSMIGARVGSKLSLKAKPFWLEMGLSALIVILALLTVFKALQGI